MNPLEQELKNALRREEPAADFAERVLARLSPAPAPRPRKHWLETVRGLFRLPALRWATAGALCFMVALSVLAYRRHQQNVERGEKARAQVMLALHIASSKLNVAMRQVQRADEPHDVRAVQNSD